MPNEPIKIQELNSTLHELEIHPCFQNAKAAAVAAINLLGIPSNLEFVPISKVPGTVANQLELAEGYADKRAAYKYNIQDTTPFDVKLFWVQKTSKRTVSSLAALTPNFEDEPFYTDKNIGIDIVTPRTTDRIFLIMSSSYNIRLVELKGGLTNTQKEIFAKWVQSFDCNNKRQIHTILWDSLDLKSLNESFYKEVTQFFSELKLHLKNAPLFNENSASHFVNRLIGRLIFCWFIQKRGLINEGKQYLEISPEEDSSTYYHNRLESLFFSVLNTPIEDRLFEDIETPFLNGGLFDPRDEDHRGKSLLTFPKDYFHRFFAFLNHYNFTTDESTSDYQQVAIDPEMLGKIFENLLAEQREDTGEQARKAKGAFYTPREIVDYMCRQSIREYLKGQLSAEEGIDEIISSLIDTREHAYDKNVRDKIAPYKTKLSSALDNVKIIDPACGSGAFPMGMLKLLEQLYERIDVRYEPHRTKLGVIKNNLFGVDIEPMAIEISRLRAWLSIIVDDDINPRLPNKGVEPLPNLDFKFVCANSLIGLDLKPKHEQLSLSGNATSDDELINKLKDLRGEWFDPAERSKSQIKKEFEETKDKLLTSLAKDWKGTVNKEEKLKLVEWDEFSDRPAIFFDPFWMFGLKEAFDIIIANPPYIKEYVNRSAFDGLRDSPYYQGKMDLWYFFACKSIDLVKDNTGIVTFIAQNNWVTSYGASNTRNKVIADTQILSLIDFGDYKVFAAGIQTMVMMFKKNTTLNEYSLDYRKLFGNNLKLENAVAILNKERNPQAEYLSPKIIRNKFFDKILTFSSSLNESVLDKILSKANFHLDPVKEIAQGIVPNPDIVGSANLKKIDPKKIAKYNIKIGDGVFVIPNNNFKGLTSFEQNLLKPLYEPTDLARYSIKNPSTKEIIYITKATESKNIPTLLQHLEKFREIMDDRRENRNGRLKYYQLHWPRDNHFFEAGPKILIARKSSLPIFAYTEKEAYVMMSINIVKSERLDLKYLLAVLNSKVIIFWLRNKGKMQGNNYQIDKEPLIGLPIFAASPDSQLNLTHLVNEIIKLVGPDGEQTNPGKQSQVEKYEKQIDQLVYKLYDLTSEEIEIVENSNR